MYFLSHGEIVSTLHTVFGLLFTFAAIFHLLNNWLSIKAYAAVPQNHRPKKVISKEMVIITVLALVVSVSAVFHWQPLRFVYEWGQSFRIGQRQEEKRLEYELHEFNADAPGTKLTLELKTGPYWRWPTYAFWVEDSIGNYIQTLYVTHKLAKNDFYIKAITKNGIDTFVEEPETKELRERPEALPVWAHKYGTKSDRGNFVPHGNNAVPDGYSGATLLTNFLLNTTTRKTLPKKFKVLFEINHSFDWNEYYSKDRFPDDLVYSGDGKVGQPSIVYEATVDLRSKEKFYLMKPTGHGHHSGKDGSVDADLSNITTALQLIDRAIVAVASTK